jgi:uncharacterized protein YdeI (YjbR/CyaY-like superfamily)
MEMAYRERWEAEIADMRRVLAGFAMKEEFKWGKPTYTVDGKNIVIMQGFKEYFGPGRQRSYLYHFAAAKQSATRVARIEKAMPAIFESPEWPVRRSLTERRCRRFR